MLPFSLGRVLLCLLPGPPVDVDTQPLKDENGEPLPPSSRRRSDERAVLGDPRLRAAHVTVVHGDGLSCCNVRVDLDGAYDAQTDDDVRVLREHGFEVAGKGALFAFKRSASLGESVGGLRWLSKLEEFVAKSDQATA